jgi:hypothetical protein
LTSEANKRQWPPEATDPAELRDTARHRTVYRVVPVRTARDCGLARLRNLSDSGLALDIAFPVCCGEHISLALSEEVVLGGRVVWTSGGSCGVRLYQSIDSLAALRQSADLARSPRGRPPRLPIGRLAFASGECGLRSVEVRDVSQRGMEIRHDGGFAPGLRVKLVLGAGVERRGVVRWTKDGLAGVLLVETFAARELGSIATL